MRRRLRTGCLIAALLPVLLAVLLALWWGKGARRVATPAAEAGDTGEGQAAGEVACGDVGLPEVGQATLPDGGAPQGASTVSDGESDFIRYTMSLDVPSCAEAVLEGHAGSDADVLVHAGYLDLFCNVWGCLVQGDGWVEVDVVQGKDDGCEVTVIRMHVKEWGESYGG